jgi:prepilin-type N-terminal cleavage/methylation domain-containing protein
MRRRLAPERGMTLVEMTIALSILAIVMAIFLPVLASVQSGFQRQSDRSQSNDQARLAVEELDREIRSGNVLYNPANENDPANGVYPGMSLRIYTQTNATTRSPGNRCVQWRVMNGQLQQRDWSITWKTDSKVSEWHIVADHIVNQPNPPAPPTTPAFQLDPDPKKGGRTIIVTVQVQQNAASGSVTEIRHSVTGRNTEYGYPSNICTEIPPY